MKNEVKLGMASVAALAAGTSAASAADASMGGYDWEGFYLGGSAGVLFGELAWDDLSGDYKLDNNFTPGVFAGYNHVLDNGVVIGAELAAQWPDLGVKGDDTSYPGDYGFNYLVDAKFKAGVTLGDDNRILAYGFGGISGGDMSAASNDMSYTAFGANYGVGVDYAVTDVVRIGVEVMGRTLDGYSDDNKMHTNGQASLRASFNF